MASQIWFSEGFDHTDAATAPLVYLTVSGTYTHVPGPFHGNAGRFAGGGNGLPGPSGGTMHQAIGFADVTRWCGFAAHVRLNAAGAGGGTPATVRLYESVYDGTVASTPTAPFAQHALEVDPDGTLRWVVGEGVLATTVASSAAGALPWGAWHHLELQVAIAGYDWLPVDPWVRVRVDEAGVLDATGTDTGVDPSGWITYGRFGNLLADGNTVAVDLDDVLWTTWPVYEMPPGYAPGPAWQGAKRIWTRFPNGEGDSDVADPRPTTEFLPTGGLNWEVNAEAPPDGDTTSVTNPDPPIPGITGNQDWYTTAPGPPAFRVPPPRPDEDPVPPADPAPAQLLLWWCARGNPTGPTDTYRGRGNAAIGTWDPEGDDPGAFSSLEAQPDYFREAGYRYQRQQGEAWRFDPEQFAGMLAFDPDDPDHYRAMADSLHLGWTAARNAPEGALTGTQCCAEFCYLPVPPVVPVPGAGRGFVLWWP